MFLDPCLDLTNTNSVTESSSIYIDNITPLTIFTSKTIDSFYFNSQFSEYTILI